MRHYARRLTGLLLAVFAALFALTLWAPAADASPYTVTDRAYVLAIERQGVILDATGEAVAIQLGQQIGTWIRANPTQAEIDTIVSTGLSTGLRSHDVAVITYYAIYFYAPECMPLVTAWTHAHSQGSVVVR